MLTIEELVRVNVARCETDFKHPLPHWSLLEWGGACVGEFGEALNVAKKIIRVRDGFEAHNRGLTYDQLIRKLGEEIADGVHYATLWSAAAGLNLENELRNKFNQISMERNSSSRL